MSVLASDNFNRADNASLGANWTNQAGAYRVLSNQAQVTDYGNDARVTYTAISWPNDQYAQAVIITGESGTSVDEGNGVCIRAGANDSYRVIASTGATGNIALSKRVSGAYTNIWMRTSAWTNSNTLYVEAQGTTIIVKNAGAAVGASTTDSALSAGNPGLEYSSTEEIAGLNRADDWVGGDFAGAATKAKPPFRRQWRIWSRRG